MIYFVKREPQSCIIKFRFISQTDYLKLYPYSYVVGREASMDIEISVRMYGIKYQMQTLIQMFD